MKCLCHIGPADSELATIFCTRNIFSIFFLRFKTWLHLVGSRLCLDLISESVINFCLGAIISVLVIVVGVFYLSIWWALLFYLYSGQDCNGWSNVDADCYQQLGFIRLRCYIRGRLIAVEQGEGRLLCRFVLTVRCQLFYYCQLFSALRWLRCC